MLIAEDLLLLLTDDRSGKLLAPANQVDVALGGAMLIELASARRVELAAGRLAVVDRGPAPDALLGDTLAEVAGSQGKKPKDVVARLGKGLRARLHGRLVERGVLREESGRILGVFPTHRWPSVDAAHEDSVRALLADALRVGATDDPHVAALVSLLHALKVEAKVVDPAAVGIAKRELKANAKRISEGDWASAAVREAIDAMLAAVTAATASTAAAGA